MTSWTSWAESRLPAVVNARPAARGGVAPAPSESAPSGDKAAETNTTSAAASPDLSKVSPRKNLNETAFFFPHLISDADGVVRMEFTMPEALTEWKFLGFAHDQQLRSGYLTDTTVTAKDLMVAAEPAALPARGRRARVHRQGLQPVRRPPDGQGAADASPTPARWQAARRGPGQHRAGAGRSTCPAKESRTLLVAADGARRLRLPHLQGRRRDRPALATARKATCRCCRGASW